MAVSVFLLLASVTSLMVTCLSCPDGFFSHAESCYVIPKQVASWPEAKVYCQAAGADLATVETDEEHRMLVAHLQTNKGSYSTPYYWIDGADFVEEGTWLWMRARERMTSLHWGPGQPNNGGGSTQQHCVDMDGDFAFDWDDGHCHVSVNFICEMPNEDAPVIG